MIKYQLERIKDMYSGISDPDRLDGIPVVTVSQSDIEWLIEQAERVQELEKELVKYRNSFELQLLINNNIKNQIKRYREALVEIRNHGTYELNNALKTDYGWIAHEALEGESNE